MLGDGFHRAAGNIMAAATEQQTKALMTEQPQVEEQLQGAAVNQEVPLQQRVQALEQRCRVLGQRLTALEQHTPLLMLLRSGGPGQHTAARVLTT